MSPFDVFLRDSGINKKDLNVEIRKRADVSGDDAVVATGSVVNGIGNQNSDIDIYIVGANRDAETPDRCFFEFGGKFVDIVKWPVNFVERIKTRFVEWVAAGHPLPVADQFSLEEKHILQRLVHGDVLQDSAYLRDYRHDVLRKDIAKLKFSVALNAVKREQVDLRGFELVGDWGSLMLATHSLIGQTMDCLLSFFELTDFGPKWRLRYAEQIPQDWADYIPHLHTELSARDYFLHLYDQVGTSEKSRAREFARTVVDMSRRLLLGLTYFTETGQKIEKPVIGRVEGNTRDRTGLDLDVICICFQGLIQLRKLKPGCPTYNLDMATMNAVLSLGADGPIPLPDKRAHRKMMDWLKKDGLLAGPSIDETQLQNLLHI